jgi:hypothetical protein
VILTAPYGLTPRAASFPDVIRRLLFVCLPALIWSGCATEEVVERGWCLNPPTADQGLAEVPSTGAALLHSGLIIDPESVVCPDASFETWVPFVGRHTAGYTADSRFGGFDENCVPLIDLEGRYGGIGITQTPLVVANYGLLRYGDLLRGFTPAEIPEPCRDPAASVLAQAEWLRDVADVHTLDGVEHWSFPYDFDNIQGEISAPWTSGYAQGIVAPAFVAAYCAGGDEQWLDAATKTLNDLTVPMADGGVATWVADDAVWFEEAAAPGARSTRSLNGQLGAAAGVDAIATWTGSAGIARLRDYAFNAVLGEIENYDVGFISLYTQWAAQHPLIAPALDYNRFQVQQLSWLHEVSGDPRALDMALRFARYDDPYWTWTGNPDHTGTLEFVRNYAYQPPWAAASPAVLDVDLSRVQTVSGLILWSPDPSLRPDRVDFQLSEDGETWSTSAHTWEQGCNDGRFDITPTRARYARVTMTAPQVDVSPVVSGEAQAEQDGVGLQAIGIVRDRGHPTGVSQWLGHGAFNRPAMALSEEGWGWSRISQVFFDLDGAFDDGLEIVMTGWRGGPLPTITRGDDLDGPVPFGLSSPLGVEPTLVDGTLTWSVEAVDFEYLQIRVDTPSNPGPGNRLFIGR